MLQSDSGQLTNENLKDGQLTQEQLALLNNLMYIDANKKKNIIGISDKANKEKKLGVYLDDININDLPEGVTDTKHEDWENIINAVKNDDKLNNLTIKSTMTDDQGASAVCFVDSKNNATAVFRGTGTYEWLDNGTGGYLTDTEQQKEALDWINSLNYNNITVSGHSKGGNKAQYVEIVSDKVIRCVAFDGQGFGEEFCEKYADKIAAKKDKITLICSQGDYVNGLFFNIAGTTVYTKSEESLLDRLMNSDNATSFSDWKSKLIDIGREHCPSTIFTFKDGKFEFKETVKQDPVTKLIHEYVIYITKNASKEDREYLFSSVMNILQGEEQRIKISLPPKGFLSRMKKLSSDWIESLNLNENQEKKMKELMKSLIKNKHLSKSQVDEFNSILSSIGNQMYKTNISASANTIRDFSMETKEKLIASIKDVEGDNPLDYKRWAQWQELGEVRGKLGIDYQHNYIDKYYKQLIEKNNSSIEKINKIFEKVYELDNEYSSKLKEPCEKLKEIEVNIKKLTERFDTSSINVDLSALKAN